MPRRSLGRLAFWSLLPLACGAGIGLLAAEAEATHLRAGTMYATSPDPVGEPNLARLHVMVSVRYSHLGQPVPGQVVAPVGSLCFGDGSCSNAYSMRVAQVAPLDGYAVLQAIDPGDGLPGVKHAYPGAGPWTYGLEACCRLAGATTLGAPALDGHQHINNPNSVFRLEGVARLPTQQPHLGNWLPDSTFCNPSSDCALPIYSALPPAHWSTPIRMSTATEAGGGFYQPGPCPACGSPMTTAWLSTQYPGIPRYVWHWIAGPGAASASMPDDTFYSTQVQILGADGERSPWEWLVTFEAQSGTGIGGPLSPGTPPPVPPKPAPPPTFLSVGGSFRESEDGAVWKDVLPESSHRHSGVAHGNGVWVTVASTGRIERSADAAHWSSAGTYGVGFDGIAYGNVGGQGLFAAVGNGLNGLASSIPTIVTSPDGARWTSSDQWLAAGRQLQAIAYGTPGGIGTFVAVGSGGLILRSSDGQVWLPALGPLQASWNAVAWSPTDGFLAVGAQGAVARSPDGSTWQSVAPFAAHDLNAVAWGAGTWVAAGPANGVHTSPDGMTWMQRPVSTQATTTWDGAAFGEGRFVLVAAYGNANASTISAPVVTSTDGVVWQSRPATAYPIGARAIAHGAGQFVAVGPYTILRSLDGLDWILGTAAPGGFPQALDYDGRQWVSVAGSVGFTSPDGRTWTARHLGTYLRDVAPGDGKWIGVGGPTVMASADGVRWSAVASPTAANLLAVAHKAGQWVAVGTGGTILTSPDGAAWTTRDSGSTQHLLDVAWGDGTWVAVGYAGQVLSSPDGVSWTLRREGTGFWPLRDVRFDAAGNPTRWVAVGSQDGVLVSADGLSWSKATLAAGTASPYAVTSHGGHWVVAAHNAVLRSADGVTWAKSSVAVGYALSSSQVQALHCAPKQQSAAAGKPVTVHGGGGAWPYLWNAPGAAPASGGEASFTTRFAAPGSYAVTLTDSSTPPQSVTCHVTVTPPPPASHTHAISFRTPGSSLHAEVLAYDEMEAPVANAIVTAEFCGPASCITRSGTTDADGQVKLNWRGATDPGTYTLCVTAIEAAGKPFDAWAGHAEQGNCAAATT
jgi:hypothetical protein